MKRSLVILAISIRLLSSCGFSSRPWVEVESHSTPWLGIASYRPPETTISIRQTITAPISPEGFFGSKDFSKNALSVRQKNSEFSDIRHIYNIRDKVTDTNKRGSILLDSSERKAIINLEEDIIDPNGKRKSVKCSENGTYDIRKWTVDGISK